jgi:diguanylate cyclase (GGDEF)-like protein
VILFDIDHFKQYNDTNGHLAGDILLRLLAQLVQENLRATDTVGRFGGEEFLVVLPGTSVSEAFLVADKLRALVADQEFPARERQPGGRLSISGGVAVYPTHGEAMWALVRAADEALYAAKRAGRNCVWLSTLDLGETEADEAKLEEEWDEDDA